MRRQLTPEESAAKDVEIASAVANGTTTGAIATSLLNGPAIRIWSTIDAANSYVAWTQANFDPAPVTAAALTI